MDVSDWSIVPGPGFFLGPPNQAVNSPSDLVWGATACGFLCYSVGEGFIL